MEEGQVRFLTAAVVVLSEVVNNLQYSELVAAVERVGNGLTVDDILGFLNELEGVAE